MSKWLVEGMVTGRGDRVWWGKENSLWSSITHKSGREVCFLKRTEKILLPVILLFHKKKINKRKVEEMRGEIPQENTFLDCSLTVGVQKKYL